MTTDEQTAPEADDSSETSGAPAQTVRVPNVSPGAKSGLDHTVIGSDALTPDDSGDDEVAELEVPDGDLASRLEWVAAGEDQAEKSARADALYGHEQEVGDTDMEELSTQLRIAVYGDGEGGDEARPFHDSSRTQAPDGGPVDSPTQEDGATES